MTLTEADFLAQLVAEHGVECMLAHAEQYDMTRAEMADFIFRNARSIAQLKVPQYRLL